MLERGDLVTLGRQSQVGAGGDQDPHGVDVARRSIAQNDRLVQCGPAQVIDVVDLDVGLDQPAGDVGVAAVGRPDQPGAIEGVLGVHVRAVLQCQVQQLQVALAGGDEVGALHGAVFGIDIGALGDEGSGAAKVVVPGGSDQLLVEPRLLLRVGLRCRRLLGWLAESAAWSMPVMRLLWCDGPEVAASPPLHAAVANTTVVRTARERTGLIGCMSLHRMPPRDRR